MHLQYLDDGYYCYVYALLNCCLDHRHFDLTRLQYFIVTFAFYFFNKGISNKLEVMQSLILHATVLKHKAALDQFRKGLATLGLLSEVEKNPIKFEKFFVHSEEDITATFVKSLLKPPQISTPDSDKAVEMLYTFIDQADYELLSNFLSFTTGSRLTTGALKPNCIFSVS